MPSATRRGWTVSRMTWILKTADVVVAQLGVKVAHVCVQHDGEVRVVAFGS